jgi:hypothetical protein
MMGHMSYISEEYELGARDCGGEDTGIDVRRYHRIIVAGNDDCRRAEITVARHLRGGVVFWE